jgi:hypothetical protein
LPSHSSRFNLFQSLSISDEKPLRVRPGISPYERLLRYEWSDPSLIGSLMMMSPLRIFILYRQEGLVQTQALYSMEAPWLPKSESGTRSPSLHLRQRGNAFSTKSPPSFSLEDSIRMTSWASEKVSRGEPLHPQPHSGQVHATAIIPYLASCVSRQMKKSSFLHLQTEISALLTSFCYLWLGRVFVA